MGRFTVRPFGGGLVATTTQRRTSASRRGQARSSAATSGRKPATQPARSSHGTTVELPFVTAEFHRPDVHLPGRAEIEEAIGTVRKNLPPPEQMVYYGGLAALAVFSVIEWPVAAAIGVGTAVAQRTAQGFGGRQRAASSTG
jgi:hypothetical protein